MYQIICQHLKIFKHEIHFPLHENSNAISKIHQLAINYTILVAYSGNNKNRRLTRQAAVH